jgi:hypothetical protein
MLKDFFAAARELLSTYDSTLDRGLADVLEPKHETPEQQRIRQKMKRLEMQIMMTR